MPDWIVKTANCAVSTAMASGFLYWIGIVPAHWALSAAILIPIGYAEGYRDACKRMILLPSTPLGWSWTRRERKRESA